MPTAEPMHERFDRLVEKGPGCWIWHGSLDAYGYGQVNIGRRGKAKAHRLSYEMAYGAIPSGLVIRHSCDTPACVKPDHLLIGTQSDNRADCVRRGRSRRGGSNPRWGEDNPNSRLTDTQRAEIMASAQGGVSQSVLAEQFGVSQTTISRTIRGRRLMDAAA